MQQFNHPRENYLSRKSIRRFIFQVLNIGKNTATGIGSNKLGLESSTVLPEMTDASADPIQDLDPLSPTFGQFFYMADYE